MAADTFGWDVGGAHVKACRLRDGRVLDVAQWPCPLWLGLQHLADVLRLAGQRWPDLGRACHAVTMTGELADLFEHRQDGVERIAGLLGEVLGDAPALRFFAGDAPWCSAAEAGDRWAAIASANWLAGARHAAQALPDDEGVLVDIGSTTTDLIAFGRGRVLTTARSDAQRLASGELVYQGVVRTPLCALGPRVPWQGRALNVMNEFFATTADVYRLTGGLAPEHDQQASADGGAKTLPASRRRLARMIGLDARDGSDADWQRLAAHWRTEQVREIRSQLARVGALHGLGPAAVLVTAGCGDFLVPEIADPGARCLAYAGAVARLAPGAPPQVAAWAQVCAPSVAVAVLLDQALGRASTGARHTSEGAA
ncbi:MAG: H4MPT-linked C1 transfer pathway protein [Burkholderiaceae bacterium]|nr:H4MPT-linked C1 transfer pathway protein [Burkholderiaceae bacterium]